MLESLVMKKINSSPTNIGTKDSLLKRATTQNFGRNLKYNSNSNKQTPTKMDKTNSSLKRAQFRASGLGGNSKLMRMVSMNKNASRTMVVPPS